MSAPAPVPQNTPSTQDSGIPTFGYQDNGDGSLTVTMGGGADPIQVADNPYVRANGTDLSGLNSIAHLESGGDYSIKNPLKSSTAVGRYQFTKRTAQHVAQLHPYPDPSIQNALMSDGLSKEEYQRIMIENPGLQDHLALHHYSDLMDATNNDPRTVSQMWLKGQYGDLTDPDAVERGKAFDQLQAAPSQQGPEAQATPGIVQSLGLTPRTGSTAQAVTDSAQTPANAELASVEAPQPAPMDDWETTAANVDTAIRNQASGEAANQKALGDLYGSSLQSMQAVGPPPAPQQIDPSQYYKNIGGAFGAKSPAAQKLIGGIVTGLFSGIGELGGALSHRPNAAQQVINEGIDHLIASQNQNNQLTRQQWADQHAYVTDQVNEKIRELAANSNSLDVKNKAEVLIAQNHLQQMAQMYSLGLMKPEEAEKLATIQDAQDAFDHLYTPSMAAENQAGLSDPTQSAAISARRMASSIVPFVENDAKAFGRQRIAAVNKYAGMLALRDGKSPTEASLYNKQAEDAVPKIGDSASTIAAKTLEFRTLLNDIRRNRELSAKGRNPTRAYPSGFVPSR